MQGYNMIHTHPQANTSISTKSVVKTDKHITWAVHIHKAPDDCLSCVCAVFPVALLTDVS